jgi:uncharacterized protein DUF5818
MKKWIGCLAALVVVVALLPAAYAQQDQSSQTAQPSAEQPSAQPDMTPQASPSQDTTAPSGQDTASPASQSTAFTGTIVKAGGKYVLKTDSQTYQLDDQEKAKVYENKQVSVTGTVDQSTSILHITDIMPASQQ